MVKLTIAQSLLYVSMVLIVVVIIAILIQSAMANVSFWLLRPAESAAMDLVGYITALGGTSGYVTAEFKPTTENITYYVKGSDKIICVIAQVSQVRGGPIAIPAVGGSLTTYNCFSTPFVADTSRLSIPYEFYHFYLTKYFEDTKDFVVVESL